MGGWSLKTRLIGLQLVVFGALALAGPATFFWIWRSLDRQFDEHLIFLARTLSEEFALRGCPAGPQPSLPRACFATPEGDVPGAQDCVHLPRHLLIQDSSGKIVCGDGETRPLAPEAVRQALASASPTTSEVRWQNEKLRLIAWPFRDSGGRWLVMEVGASHFVIERALGEGIAVLAISSALALLFLLGASFILASRALAPMDRIVWRVEQIDEANLKERLPVEERSDEAARLVVVVNRMLSRLERAFESQKRFSTDVAHEIRSPLTSLRGQIEVALRKARPEEEYRQVLRENLDDVLRLSRLAEDLMSLAQADAGVLEMRRLAVDLREMLSHVVRRFRTQADQKDIRLVLHAPEPLTVLGDPDWLERVVANLIDNALRYSPRLGQVEVRLARGSGRAVISVTDSGPGIEPEHLPHLFERFYRAAPSRSRDEGGTGLGLAIAKQITDLHGASVRVESTVGQGSSFTVEIPLARPTIKNN
ncbi:MAG: HAMP domain-containing protein [Candidatus Riflebacteria bacterium]|nr:HAMP domain-containing protein [Candidatus Riflebacteria bacterium]